MTCTLAFPAPLAPTDGDVPDLVDECAAADVDLLRRFDDARALLLPALEALDPTASHGDRSLSELERAFKDRGAVAGALWDRSLALLCRHAEECFKHPSGVVSPISIPDVREALGVDSARRRRGYDEPPPERPPYRAVWAYLAATYGGDAATRALEAATVDAFIQRFLRVRGWPAREGVVLAEPVWRRGRLVLTEQAWSEKTFRGGTRYTYSTREHLHRSFRIAADMLRLVGGAALAEGLEALAHHQGPLDGDIVSRERRGLPHDSALITYQAKIEIELGGEIAAELIARVGAHVQEHGVGAS